MDAWAKPMRLPLNAPLDTILHKKVYRYGGIVQSDNFLEPPTAGVFQDVPLFHKYYAQDMVVGFSSVMMILFKKLTALRNPSSMVIKLSSCSMESTRS